MKRFKRSQYYNNINKQMQKKLRIAILQRVVPGYRKALFELLSSRKNVVVKLFIGSDIPNSKVSSDSSLDNLDVHKLPTSFFYLSKKRQLINHQTLLACLSEFNPDVILCEGESNILSYLKAVCYRLINPETALVHWSLGGLPGTSPEKPLRRYIKRRLLSLFDAFVVYSSYGQEKLSELGLPSDQIHVAVNVSDTQRHISAARNLMLTKEQARQELGLPMAFTVLYAGTLDDDKSLDKLLTAFNNLSEPRPNLVVLGDGPLRAELETKASELGLRHAFFPGRVSWEEMAKFYRAGDVFVLPGRGGMVISEAMAHGLPVIVHQADGTEVDLVRDGITGYRLESGSPKAVCAAIKKLSKAPHKAAAMGVAGQLAVEKNYTLDNMAQRIQAAAMQAIKQRRVS